MRSIILSFVIVVLACSFCMVQVNAQSADPENGNTEGTETPIVADDNVEAVVGGDVDVEVKIEADDDNDNPSLVLPPLHSTDGNSIEIGTGNNEVITTSPENTTVAEPTPAGENNSSDNSKVDSGNNNSNNDGMSRSWNEWNEKFSPKNETTTAPNGTLPQPQPYGSNNYGNSSYGNSGYGGGYGSSGYGNNGYGNSGYGNSGYGSSGYGNGYGYNYGYNNQSVNAEQIEDGNKPIPYLMWHRDPWTHRLNLAPYAPGYAAAPQDFLVPPSNYSLFLTSFPSHGNYWRQPRYLGYYDPMPEIVEATPSRNQLILGYPNTPQTQYRDPYSGQPLNYNPAINPESIIPVRESLLDRWRRRSIARRAAPLGQFPGQAPILQQPIQSPLFGQPYEQPYAQPYPQQYPQSINQQNSPYQNEQFQYNQQFQEQPRYARRPPSRFRQGLRERIQRLGIFEAFNQRRAGNEIPNNQNYNINYSEAPAYDGTN